MMSLCAFGMNASAQAQQNLFAEDFNGNWTQLQADGWKRLSYNEVGAPANIPLDDNTNQAMRFNNFGLWNQFAAQDAQYNNIELNVNLLANNYSRTTYVVLATAPNSEGRISGYGLMMSTANANQFDGRGYYVIQKFDNILETDMKASSSGGTNISSQITTGITFLADGNAGTDPTLSSQFGSVRLTWDSSGAIRLYMGDNSTAALSVTDTAFNTFSSVYISGNTSGYFEELTISGAQIPEAGTVSVIIALAALGTAMLLRRRCN